MSDQLQSSAERVRLALVARGLDSVVVEMPSTTRSAKDAAAAIGCTLPQIAKSLVFRTVNNQRPVLVIVSGSNRVSEQRLAEILGEPIEKADADYVREKTGFAIGGVPPVGHPMPVETFIDVDLMSFEVIWAAAGTPNAVFRLTPQDLLKITHARIVRIT
jgi:prolyl-tRNA editing enzyme YbaK/EbsC (Cys-tRNA(Pro) deacylase)